MSLALTVCRLLASSLVGQGLAGFVQPHCPVHSRLDRLSLSGSELSVPSLWVAAAVAQADCL